MIFRSDAIFAVFFNRYLIQQVADMILPEQNWILGILLLLLTSSKTVELAENGEKDFRFISFQGKFSCLYVEIL